MTSVRPLLFVAAGRLDRLPRALACGADLICIDLEGSGPLTDKELARQAAALMPLHARDKAIGVRIKSVSDLWEADARQAGKAADFVMVLKAKAAGRLAEVASAVQGKPLWPIIKGGRGILIAYDASPTAGVQPGCRP